VVVRWLTCFHFFIAVVACSLVAQATRWDIYLSMDGQTHDDIHWLSITNSILVAVFLTALVALILVRTLRKDLMRYNRIPTDEERAEELEESGWKLVHGDVFRPPGKVVFPDRFTPPCTHQDLGSHS
jgi:hypothetical protein